MALTVTLDSPRPIPAGPGHGRISGTIAFDDSYAATGESVSDITKFFSNTLQVHVESTRGYGFEYDDTNGKVKVFAPAPPVVYEEVHTIPATPYAITLNYPAAAIINVASATACYGMIEASDTLASGEVQLTAAMAAGTRTGLTFEATQTTEVVYVTYITQAWAEVWNNRQAAQVTATATHVADLGKAACFIESCLATGTTGSSRPEFLRGGDTAATTECEVDFTDAGAGTAGDTTLTFVSTDAITTTTCTYIEKPASGFLADRFVEDFDCTIAAGASAALCPLHPVLFQGLCGQVPDYTAANERDAHPSQMLMGDALGTANEFTINYQQRPGVGVTDVLGTNDATTDAVSLTYVWGVPAEIPGVVPLEVRDATDLSALTAVRFTAYGFVPGKAG